MLQTDCPIVSGDSGGPLFDLGGRVIGIHSRIGPSASSISTCRSTSTSRIGIGWSRARHGTTRSRAATASRCGPPSALVVEANPCVAQIKCNGQDAALGPLVRPERLVLTKASELRGKITCRLRDQREFKARLVGVHRGFDLAMLKIEGCRAAVRRLGRSRGLGRRAGWSRPE